MATTFTARFATTCVKCGEAIKAGEAITWARRGTKGTLHASCGVSTESAAIPQSIPSESAQTIKPVTVSNNDAGNVFAGFAAMLQPYIQASTDGIEERIQAAIDKALESIPSNRITLFDPATKETKTVDGQHQLFSSLLKLVTVRKNVYAWGEAGSGKSSAARTIAHTLGLSFGYLACNNQTPEYRLTGFIDAKGEYIPTDFYKCYVNGGVFLLDEADAANGNLMCSLNGALANGSASFPNGTQERHKDFVCIATGNTPGFGPVPAFPDRRPLDSAFRDRFAFLEWNTDTELETKAASAQNPQGKVWAQWIQSVRKYAKTAVPKLAVTQRASIEGASLIGTFPVAEIAEMYLFKGIDRDSVSKVLSNFPLPAVN